MKKAVKELEGKTVKELEKMLGSERMEIAKLGLSAKSAPVKDTNALFKRKKKLAVLLTVMGQKKEDEKIKKLK